MDTIKLEVVVPKEMQEVSVSLQSLVKAFVEKKPIAEIAATELPKVMVAVDGIQKVGEEAKSAEAADCIALLGSGIYKAFKK